uniref:Natural killer cells antigen CD94 n=1 Tax=Ornithorhynchus anatinus TaxID=9258 RepID=F6SRV5_ORNAN
MPWMAEIFYCSLEFLASQSCWSPKPRPLDKLSLEHLLQTVGSQSKLWKVTALSLGIFCLVLLVTAGFLAAQVTQQQGVSTNPFPNTINETGCDWGPCPGDWIGFRDSCYLFSNDRKNWRDSKSACAARNSSLLWIDNQEEQVFLEFFSLYAWIGLSRNEPGNSWKWEDGTDFSNHQFTIIKIQTEGNCVFQSARYYYEGNCEDLEFFVCKWRTHS